MDVAAAPMLRPSPCAYAVACASAEAMATRGLRKRKAMTAGESFGVSIDYTN